MNNYPVSMRVTARQMYGNGDAWNATEIARYLQQHAEPGQPTPSARTIRYWVNDDSAARHRDADKWRRRVARARRVLELDGGATPLADGDVDRRMLALRHAGLTYPAIARVLGIYHGIVMSADTVRDRCRRLGAPPKLHGVPFGSTLEEAA